MFKWKLMFGIFFLFTGFFSIVGIGLILLYMLDEWKKTQKVEPQEDSNPTDTYISPDVIEEFR